jgi:uncharacterized protein (UPF0254 family)
MIVMNSAGDLYRVAAAEGIDHAWTGTPVKKTAAGYLPKAKAIARLVRKAGCVVVAVEAQ